MTVMSSAVQEMSRPEDEAVAGQFSLRALLVLIFVAAILCAVAMPRVRHWPSELQIGFAVVCFSYFAIVGAMFFASRVFSRRRLRNFGALLLSLPSSWTTRIWATFVTFFVAWLMWIYFWSLDATAHRDIDVYAHRFPNPWWLVFMATTQSWFAWDAWLSPREIRERGIMWAKIFYGWKTWSGFRWHDGKSLKLVLQSKFATLPRNAPHWLELLFQATCATRSFRIPRSQRENVDQILQERLRRLPESSTT
jgi:hypothetical protein